MNLTFLFPKEFLSDPSVPLGPPVKDLDRLLLQERAKAAAYINLLRIATAAVSVAALYFLPSTGSLALDRIQVGVLAALLAWGVVQHLAFHRHGRVVRWLMPANAAVDISAISALVAAWGALASLDPTGRLAAPEFFGYFVVLSFRPITLTARTSAIMALLCVAQYAAIVAALFAADRLGVTTVEAIVPWWHLEVIKLIILVAAGTVITAAAAWYQRVLRRALTKQAVIEDELRETVRTLEQNVDHLSRTQTALRESEERYRTVNRELEERVLDRTKQLQAANKELEAFSYSVSHDLRAPLRAIKGFTNVIAEEDTGPLSPEVRRMLTLVQSNAARMGTLIDCLLEFARLSREPIAKSTVQPIDITYAVIESLRDDIEDRTIEWRVISMPPCLADPVLLTQVYTNLISNAVKFTRHRDSAVIEIGSGERDGVTAYYVRDNGVGFDMEYADRLFKVFQRLHSEQEFEGTGVGLALVQRIVDRHGGRIWAEAEPDNGACFYFTV